MAEAEWFHPAEFGKTGQRTRYDQFSNRVIIKRRPGGRFHLEISCYEGDYLDLDAKKTRALVWFRENGAELDAAVARVMQSIFRPSDRGGA